MVHVFSLTDNDRFDEAAGLWFADRFIEACIDEASD
jgi:hypothetical protein